MKTTIEIPDHILREAKVVAAQRSTSLKELVLAGLDIVLKKETENPDPQEALLRLKKGFHLGGRPLKRQELHER